MHLINAVTVRVIVQRGGGDPAALWEDDGMSVEVSREEIREWNRVEREYDLCDYSHPIPAIECTAREFRLQLIEHGNIAFAKRYDCPVALLDTLQMTVDGQSMTLAEFYSRGDW